MAGRRLHDDPILDPADRLGAKPLQPLHFCFDIGRLNVEVHAAGMIHLLDLDIHAAGAGSQLAIARLGVRFDRQSQGLGPESRGAAQILGLAIDDETDQSALVHLRLRFM